MSNNTFPLSPFIERIYISYGSNDEGKCVYCYRNKEDHKNKDVIEWCNTARAVYNYIHYGNENYTTCLSNMIGSK